MHTQDKDSLILKTFSDATKVAVKAMLPLHENIELNYKDSAIYRDGKELVTEADTLSDSILSNSLRKVFPSIPCVTEEQAGSHVISSESFFTVDGLDGTICFAGKYPGAENMWGILLGYIEQSEIQLASIYLRATDEVITINRKTATIHINGKLFVPNKFPDTLTIAMDVGVWQSDNVEKYVLPKLKEAGITCIIDRPSAAGIADYLIKGRVHAWVSRVARIWDVAPIVCAVHALGGLVEPLYEDRMDWLTPYPKPAIYSASKEVIKEIKDLLLSLPKDQRF